MWSTCERGVIAGTLINTSGALHYPRDPLPTAEQIFFAGREHLITDA